MVFYRKYRPQKISELDSETVRNSLYSILSKKDCPHAFLFTGPKGLGKTSTARIVAKVLNCEKHKDLKGKLDEKEIEPCNKCNQCTSITNGNNLDVLEIDGASNRGIDEIRDLKEKINLLPSKASKKVYIIDEVHMLTTEAFNALLKTLEEPPPHAVFILCTTEFHKLPQTIVSRCFRVDFARATDEEITRSLTRIIKAEEIKIEKEAILEIAKMSDGSFRDGAKILEEAAIFAGRKTINAQVLGEKYNTLGIEKSLEEFANCLISKDVKKGFEITSALSKQGMDFKFFIEKLMGRFHLMLLEKLGSSNNSSNLELNEIKTILELLTKAHMDTKYAVLPQLPLELMLVEFGNVKLRSQSDLESSDFAVQAPISVYPRLKSLQTASTRPKSPAPATPLSDTNFYQSFIEEVKNHNHLIAGVLRSCEIAVSKKGILEISAISKFHKDKLDEKKSMLILEEVARNLLSKKVIISVMLRG